MKRVTSIVIIFLSIFVINNLVQSIYSLWQKQDLLVDAKQELEREKRENTTLKGQLEKVKEPQFVEEQARNKLLLVKEGEHIVVASDNLIVDEQKVLPAQTEQKENWKQWLELFLKPSS